MTKYKIFDCQIADYIEPYDEDRDYWTLEGAKDLAIRRQEEARDIDGSEYYENNTRHLNEIQQMTTEKEIAKALADFEYVLQPIEDKQEKEINMSKFSLTFTWGDSDFNHTSTIFIAAENLGVVKEHLEEILHKELDDVADEDEIQQILKHHMYYISSCDIVDYKF